MKKLFPVLGLALFSVMSPLWADAGGGMIESRFHAALNNIVQEVQAAKTPLEKREILHRTAVHVAQGVEQAKLVLTLNDADVISLGAVQKKFETYQAELDGKNGFTPVADADLNNFAVYMQQDMEQAGGEGIYLSGGALIIIVLLLILIF